MDLEQEISLRPRDEERSLCCTCCVWLLKNSCCNTVSLKNLTVILAYECQVEKKDSNGQSTLPCDGEIWGKMELALRPGLGRLPAALFPQPPSGPHVPQLHFTEELGPPSGRSQKKAMYWNLGSSILPDSSSFLKHGFCWIWIWWWDYLIC